MVSCDGIKSQLSFLFFSFFLLGVGGEKKNII